MLKIRILSYTKNPLTTIGERAAVCYNTKLKDSEHAKRIGMSVLKDGHGRNLEFPKIDFVIEEGCSARMERELYTHIGGAPTRVQSSTRYITYKDFNYYIPNDLTNEQRLVYEKIMEDISNGYGKLKDLGCENDITGYVLPLALEQKMVWSGNARNLENLFNQRLCKRALKEFQDFAKELKKQISELDEEWKWIADNLYVPKCVKQLGICFEARGCGLFPKYKDFKPYLDEAHRKYREDNKLDNE